MLRDYLRLSIKSLRHRSLRSWLTVLGIVVGVAAVVALIAIGGGMQRSVKQQFETIGYNTIILGSAGGKTLTSAKTIGSPATNPQGSKTEPLVRKPTGSKPDAGTPDLESLKHELDAAVESGKMTSEEASKAYVMAGVRSGQLTREQAVAAYQQMMGSTQESGDPKAGLRAQANQSASAVHMSGLEVLQSLKSLPMVAAAGAQREETAMVTSEEMNGLGILRLIGMTPSMPENFPLYFAGYVIGQGRTFTDDDLNVVVLGPNVASDLEVDVGDEIVVESTPFEVIGILTEQETESNGGFTVGDVRYSLFVPLPALESLFGNYGSFSMGLVEVTEGTNIEQATKLVRDTFTQAGTPVSVTTASELSAQIGAALGSVNLTLSAIAAIALLVGALGVMNTMYMSVLERTREIGIMKAVGAKDRDVLGLFLIESSMLGFIGGALGILLGAGISGLAGRLISSSLTVGTVTQAVEAAGLHASEATGIHPVFSPWLILAALGLSLALGALAGVLPAWRGAKLPPVKALRYE